jgi:hypothetical protein
MRPRLWLLALLPLAACDCGTGEVISELVPDIVVTPPTLDMGEVAVGLETDALLNIGNVGTAALSVFSAELGPLRADSELEGPFVDDQGAFFSVDAPTQVFATEIGEATVTANPDARGRYAATLTLETDDPDERTVLIDVLAIGGPPRIAAVPEALDFGDVNEGAGAARTVQLQNTGFDTLDISAITIEGATAFALDEASPASGTVEVGESITVTVRLDPSVEAVTAAGSNDLTGDLVVTSNAENAAELRVPLTGSVNLAPQAIAVELITRLKIVKAGVGAEITVDGSETVDPEGDPITFTWTLEERPEPSFSFLFTPRTADACADDTACDAAAGFICDQGQGECREFTRARFIPDVVGRYLIRLRATDARGAFQEDTVEILPKDLALVLRWSSASDAACQSLTQEQCDALTPAERRQQCCNQSDLDLHLVRPGGTLGDYGSCPGGCVIADPAENRCFEVTDTFVDTCRQLGTDCAFANRFPEWGVSGRVDDPRLDIDDVAGLGPEIVSLNEPEDGTYTVFVHYCNDRNTSTEPTEATLEIVVEGVVTATAGPQRIDTEGPVWVAASLVRSNGAWDLVTVPDIFEPVVPQDLCGF